MSFENPEGNKLISEVMETATELVYSVSSWYSTFLVFGCVFMISGTILSIIASYNLHRSAKTPVFGPLLLSSGFLSCFVGTLLGIIYKKRQNEVKQRRHIYKNFSNPPIQVREEQHEHCFTISQNSLEHGKEETAEQSCYGSSNGDIASFPKYPHHQETPAPATSNLLTVPGLMVTVSAPSKTKILQKKRASYRLRHQTLDVLNDSFVLEIPSSRRSSYHGDSIDISEPQSRCVSPSQRLKVVDGLEDMDRRGSLEKERECTPGSPVIDTH